MDAQFYSILIYYYLVVWFIAFLFLPSFFPPFRFLIVHSSIHETIVP